MKRELARFAKKLQRGQPRAHWQGVYARASDVPVEGPGFDGEVWLDMTRSLTRHALVQSRSAKPWTAARSDTQLLATVVALCARQPVRILDFGGGMGVGYVMLRSALAPAILVDYQVVEGARVCVEGAWLVDNVRFETSLPEADRELDIVYAASSLQYIDDHAALLATFAGYRPRHIVLADVPAGDVPTFWTAQLTVPGSAIAYKFMNLAELVQTMAKLDYKLLVRGVAERPIDVASLPATHRVERTCNLLFGR